MRGSLKGCNYQEFLVKTPWSAASQSQNCTKSSIRYKNSSLIATQDIDLCKLFAYQSYSCGCTVFISLASSTPLSRAQFFTNCSLNSNRESLSGVKSAKVLSSGIFIASYLALA